MKSLKDVFMLLENSRVPEDILTNTEVVKLKYSEDHTVIYAFLKFNRIVDQSALKLLTNEIRERYFKTEDVRFAVVDSYELPEDYTLSDVVTLYKDNIVREVIELHPSLKSALSHAEWEVKDATHLVITIDRNAMMQSIASDFEKRVVNTFLRKFSMECELEFRWREPKKHIFMTSDQETVVFQKPEPVSKPAEDASQENPAKKPSSNGGDYMLKQKKTAAPQQGSLNRGRKEFGAVKTPKNYVKPENVIYGRAFEDEAMPLNSYVDPDGETIVIRAEIMTMEAKPLRNGTKTLFTVSLTDYTDSINMKLFTVNEEADELKGLLKPGKTVLVKGQVENDQFDHELSISRVYGVQKYDLPLQEKRKDNSEVKRVELHAHTKSSDNDAIIDADVLVKTAISWGHKAIAITDHGNVQSFPKAFHALPADGSFKILYGMEGYLVDDTKELVVSPKNFLVSDPYVAFSIKTSGSSKKVSSILEIGAVKVVDDQITERFSSYINPGFKLPYRVEESTGIRNDRLSDAPSAAEVLPKFLEFAKGCYLVSHNAEFDVDFILENLRRSIPDIGNPFSYVDTTGLSRALLTRVAKPTLDHVAKELTIPISERQHAIDDALLTNRIYAVFQKRLANRNILSLQDIDDKLTATEDVIKKMESHHVIIFAASETGRVNLYSLVSDSNLKYFAKRPRIPKSLLQERREGLIVGSACSAGELYKAILNGAPDEELARIANFYDYLEIQPLGNNQYLINDTDYDFITSREDLIAINKRIIALGELYNKPVCATGDVHFLNPEDSIYRQILQMGCGYRETEEQPPIYLRTTDEMLKEFDYLGYEKAFEVVVENPNKIADMIGVVRPVAKEKHPPVIENSDVDLRNHAFQSAREIYGENLPEIVEKRLERELNAIINNGYAVMYAIAHKLINKSLADGYLVGSRGSVGSSFAATMYNITEVNGLQPHYVCPNCKYSEWDSKECVENFDRSGWDMPDKNCPHCGTKMKKDGYNIPFETFMGFKGNKEPDIDLNFSDEYQSKAHAYTAVIFGAGQTFKAGTVGTVAEKTAVGYVLHYCDDIGVQKRKAEVNRLASHIVGVKRTTGQHPGGIIVLPLGEDINYFTPVQHPADKDESNIITTHFDYHSIDENLLKLDILGHQDPTMIRMLHDLIGIDPRSFPLDAPEIMSLFRSTDALGIKPEDIHGVQLGVLGIPEFGTDTAIGMLLATKPEYVSDLIRISGLAHGTDVWSNNAETLISEGKATIQTCICTRDDIMTYLIGKGIENETAFSIMENVRKGKVAKKKCDKWPEWKQLMIDHDVPDWYIWSCERIQYMFPKAHAAAYVMMALRIAYAKIFYPLAYYSAYFSIRGSGFNYEMMATGHSNMEKELERLRALDKNRSTKEDDQYRDIRIVEEMYARGFSFVPIDIYKVDATRFQIVSDKEIMPSLVSIDGMGQIAADTLVEAAQKGPFTSVSDLRRRTKVSQTLIDKMTEMHILDGLPKDDQISLFDSF